MAEEREVDRLRWREVGEVGEGERAVGCLERRRGRPSVRARSGRPRAPISATAPRRSASRESGRPRRAAERTARREGRRLRRAPRSVCVAPAGGGGPRGGGRTRRGRPCRPPPLWRGGVHGGARARAPARDRLRAARPGSAACRRARAGGFARVPTHRRSPCGCADWRPRRAPLRSAAPPVRRAPAVRP